ncbi:MAG: DNA-packaging protein [Calditrichaeota bacterium]|nr:DNA-packaging protein [Calditrichota bacterium]
MTKKTKTSRGRGQPLIFPDVEKLQEAINAFFQKCDETNEPYTITGLALALNTSRQTLINYENREKYFDTIKNAKLRVENYAEKKLFTGHATGPIFALKNFGWEDSQNHAHSGELNININKTVVDGNND